MMFSFCLKPMISEEFHPSNVRCLLSVFSLCLRSVMSEVSRPASNNTSLVSDYNQ